MHDLAERFNKGERRALSRLLSYAAHGVGPTLLSGGPKQPEAARVIAITGSGGVGKSTLIGKLIEYLRSQGKTVAVLACDPQSPITGGAILGDRIRMPSPPEDEGVFIRSLATPGGQEAIANNIRAMIDLLSAYGFNVILVETVGAGQGDTAVREYVDTVVVLLQPETGDDLQWEKAGLLEIADVLVVHKADLAGAESMRTRLNDLLNLPGCRQVPVVLVSSSKNTGVPEMWKAIESAEHVTPDGRA